MANITYCYYQVRNGTLDSGKCTAQMIVIINSFICLVIMVFLLILELTRTRFQLRMLVKLKTLIFFFCSLELLDSCLHYLVYTGNTITYSLIFLEINWFICFFLVCYFFCKKSSNILLTYKKWLFILKILLALSIALLVGILVFLFVYNGISSYTNGNDLC